MKNFIILNNHRLKIFIKSIFLITVLYFFILFVFGKIEIEIFFYLSILFFVNFSLFYIYLSSKKESNYIPIYPLIICYYLFTYSAYFYFHQGIHFYFKGITNEYLELLPYFILVLLVGIIFFSLGYFLPNYYFQKKQINIFKNINFKNVNKYQNHLMLLFTLILLFYYINYPNKYINIGVLNQLKEPLIYFLLIFLQIKYFQKENKFLLVLNILFLLFFFIIELSFGATVFPYLLIGCFISINYYKTKIINIISIIIIMISVFFIHSIKHDIREKTWTEHKIIFEKNQLLIAELEKLKQRREYLLALNNPLKQDELHRINAQILIIQKKINDLKKKLHRDKIILKNMVDTIYVINNKLIQREDAKNRINSQKQRLFHSNISLQIVVAYTPKEIGFYNGVSYKNLRDKFIPRFINKNKSEELWGNFWGKRYKILKNTDNQTSWNFPVLNEFYANFGLKGVIIGMFLWGLLIKVLIIVLNFNSRNIVAFCATYTILFNLFFQESNLTMILGRLINEILFFVAIFILILLINYFFGRITFKNHN